jgi:MoaA/NifB/PqqE/SkfB family radical SAM enzyme
MKEVIVSLDGSQAVHDEIRNVPQGFDKIVAGIRSIRSLKSDFRVTGRCVVQRHNFRDLIHTVKESRAIGLDQISFLAADVSTTAFNHQEAWTDARAREVALNAEESSAFEQIVQQSFVDLEDDYHKGFIAERPQKMTRIVQYYKAINGLAEFPETVCNAPWVSAVIESDGRVMPCFFHKPYGNIYDGNLADILNSEHAIGFRRNLDVHTDPVCKKCVCSLKLRVWD